jgi:hypothetical protein
MWVRAQQSSSWASGRRAAAVRETSWLGIVSLRKALGEDELALCKKQLEREHVILNEVKDLVPAMQAILERNSEILRLRLRMTCFTKCLY